MPIVPSTVAKLKKKENLKRRKNKNTQEHFSDVDENDDVKDRHDHVEESRISNVDEKMSEEYISHQVPERKAKKKRMELVEKY